MPVAQTQQPAGKLDVRNGTQGVIDRDVVHKVKVIQADKPRGQAGKHQQLKPEPSGKRWQQHPGEKGTQIYSQEDSGQHFHHIRPIHPPRAA